MGITDPAEGAPDVTEELLALHRRGRLAIEYPRVTRLVAELSGHELLRAGQLLSHLEPDEVRQEHPEVPAVTAMITGHGTLTPLIAPLIAQFTRHGMLLRPELTEFDGYFFALADPASALYAARADLTLCVLDSGVVFDKVPLPWRPADVEAAAEREVDLIEQLASTFEAAGRGTLVLNTLPLPRLHSAQLVDHRSRARLGAAWRRANARLLGIAESHAAVVVIDLDPLLAEGRPARDPRLDTYARAHLSPELLDGYAREIGHLARHVAGLTKKGLALDLDGTVWGGIIGDDGIEGIAVAEGHRGEAFRSFQRVVRQLGSQGVLLAALSKNDQGLVHEALREHPQMTLREDDLVRVVANWRPKHDNIADLASALNLGTDTFVFVDDSPLECALMREQRPEVTVVCADGDPALHAERLLDDGWFDVREVTADDRARPARYREELARADLRATSVSVASYLHDLKVRVRLSAARETEVARLSQITLRTNQFNLTTRRLQPAGVRALLADPAVRVVAIRAADRFGDNGLVGAVFMRSDGDAADIDNFLLSCRVFSRGIEQASLAALLRSAREHGATAVRGFYRPTARNHVVADFYRRHGFAQVADDGTTRTFRHDLASIVAVPDHVELTEDLQP
ncbi:MAG: HAD-IIIC family phosphatase [Trebonia sp.]